MAHGAKWDYIGCCWVWLWSRAVFRNIEVYIPYSEYSILTTLPRLLYSLIQWCFGLLLFFPPFDIAYCLLAERLFCGHLRSPLRCPHQPLYLLRHYLTLGNEIRTRIRRRETDISQDLHLLYAAPAIGISSVNLVKAVKNSSVLAVRLAWD